VVNSGCANACTGDEGLSNAWNIARLGDDLLGKGTLLMSTGVIGQHLQMDKISSGLKQCSASLGSSHNAWMDVAKAVMTTDTFPKLISKEVITSSGTFRICGFSKGAGMIHPNMATMLSGVFTDAKISKKCLDKMIASVANLSFNSISIDGDTSTNDSFVIMANGASNYQVDEIDSKEYLEFQKSFSEVAIILSKLIVRDGEGATKFVEIHVKGAKTVLEAKQVASTVSKSPLVKTAIFGKDANWGRIVCAVGYSGVKINPSLVNLYLASEGGSLHLFKNGMPFDCNEEKASAILDKEDLLITIDLQQGKEEFKMYTCDLSHDYITINADYRS
jgi:glutamate N-acetyltransferase/amino-acid N-acetyltransferase